MDTGPDTKLTFTVDTHLFRELGELLVGRDSTALVELIKNAYDADATEVIVFAQDLQDPASGTIRLADNGVGMSLEDFRLGFLRIASRSKDHGSRESKRYGRRYTGAKGIGRLAAHKLATEISVESIPWEKTQTKVRTALEASINWSKVEQCTTLDELEEKNEQLRAVQVRSFEVDTAKCGTTITLSHLRRKWPKDERTRFISEVQMFSPPRALTDPVAVVVGKKLLFDRPKVRLVPTVGNQFEVKLEGEFSVGEELWTSLPAAAEWVIEIRASRGSKHIEYSIAPTRKTKKMLPDARGAQATELMPSSYGPFFEARILVKEGGHGERLWPSHASGIKVYMEGFRVPPYGESQNDWLGIDADYTRRNVSAIQLPPLSIALSSEKANETLSIQPNRAYFGAVFLTQDSSPELRMLVNREGFVPTGALESIAKSIRTGINICVRLRAAAKASVATQDSDSSDTDRGDHLEVRKQLQNVLVEARGLASEARQLTAAGNSREAHQKFSQAVEVLGKASAVSEDILEQESMVRVLASVGTQMSSFIHEINSLLGMAQAVESALGRISTLAQGSRELRKNIAEVQQSVTDLRRNLERQASYLVDVVTPDARRRRVRLNIAERFDAGARLVARIAEARGITIQNRIPEDLKSPPMYAAELTTVFSNLITNATKAAGAEGKIRSTGTRRPSGEIVIRVENSGVAIDLDESERWFRPFESTTLKTDPVLGQGMGLGLTITRNMLEQYGAEIKFVRPTPGFTTAIEITFPVR